MTGNNGDITGVERFFSPDTFIVSKTDAKGIITYVNDVFLDVAGYRMEEVMGKPHNMIRHPWMPRCIFRLLWDRIKSGNEIFAYVVNRTKSGDHYWVLAHVTPSFNKAGEVVGYHSNRRVPKREAVSAIEPLYHELRTLEDGCATPKQAVETSFAQLQAWVSAQGGNYDALVFAL